MKTDELIHELGLALKPVRRLPTPGRRAALWLSCGGVYVAAAVMLAWVRREQLGVEVAGPFTLQQVGLVLTGVLAAVAAFASVIPGLPTRARDMVVLPLGLMMAGLGWGMLLDVQQFGTVGFGRETDWPCVISTAVGGLVLWGLAAAMLRRGAVLEPRLTATLAGVAALSLANVAACLSRAHAYTATIVVWHGVTALLLIMGLLTLGPILLTRQPRP